MVIYGVHTQAWGQVGEIEVLSAERSTAERHARTRSSDWPHGLVAVTARELDSVGCLRVLSEWRNGSRIDARGDGPGEWRKTKTVC